MSSGLSWRACPASASRYRIRRSFGSAGGSAEVLYQFTLQSPDAPELYRDAAQFEERLRAMGDFRDVGSDLQLKNPQLKVVLDRDRASTMGITAQGISQRQVEEAFWSAYATRQVSTINTPNNQYQVIVEARSEVPK